VAEAVYVLCAATSVACAVLLLRAYARTGAHLLLWSGLCFVCLGANNVLLFLDLVWFSITPTCAWSGMRQRWRGCCCCSGAWCGTRSEGAE
jgi:hypothetical protein